jgi:hypothetical protein
MKKESCLSYKNGKCNDQRSECEKRCCCECKHGQEMTCSLVCPTAAGIMHPSDDVVSDR